MRDVVQEKHGIEEGEVCGRSGCAGDLRPYGPNGADVCFPCAMETPERKAEASSMFAAQFKACGGVVVIGESIGPYPIEHASEDVKSAVAEVLDKEAAE